MPPASISYSTVAKVRKSTSSAALPQPKKKTAPLEEDDNASDSDLFTGRFGQGKITAPSTPTVPAKRAAPVTSESTASYLARKSNATGKHAQLISDIVESEGLSCQELRGKCDEGGRPMCAYSFYVGKNDDA
jgi:hypothetical protein